MISNADGTFTDETPDEQKLREFKAARDKLFTAQAALRELTGFLHRQGDILLALETLNLEARLLDVGKQWLEHNKGAL